MISLITWLVSLVDLLVAEKVLLVSMDGFRWDYTQLFSTPYFDRMSRQGAKANYVVNTFTTETFPCHYSIVTGSYTLALMRITGECTVCFTPIVVYLACVAIGNKNIEKEVVVISGTEEESEFNMSSKDTKWWNQAEPIWVTARRQGLKSAVYFWPGSETEIKGYRPTEWMKYDETVPFNDRVDTVIEWLSVDIDIALLYFHEPDNIGHIYGPNSEQVRIKVEEMDTLLGSIMHKLDLASLSDKVNLIITSDHGMTDIDVRNNIITLSDHIDLSMIEIFTEDIGPVINILHKEGHLAELYIKLNKVPHMSVYIKDDIPDKWHYKHSRRILPLLLVAEEGWLLSMTAPKTFANNKGGHGYDNELRSMNPIFYAKGPSIRQNIVVDHINSVDIYPFMCLLLGITPAPNNGTLEGAMQMVKKRPD